MYIRGSSKYPSTCILPRIDYPPFPWKSILKFHVVQHPAGTLSSLGLTNLNLNTRSADKQTWRTERWHFWEDCSKPTCGSATRNQTVSRLYKYLSLVVGKKTVFQCKPWDMSIILRRACLETNLTSWQRKEKKRKSSKTQLRKNLLNKLANKRKEKSKDTFA